MKKYVIIGNGTAAVGCVEGIRAVDREGSITVISAEKHPVYCRPLISYYLEGKTTPEKMNYRSATFYEDNACDVRYGVSAVSADPTAHTVTLDDGTTLSYDSLCVATGSSPFVPPFAGLDTVEKKFSFLTLDDAFDIERAIAPDSRVLIVGAGLIGLKCAEGIADRVGSITVCDLSDRVLSSILDAECAGRMQRRLEEHGIRFLLGDSAAQFEGNVALMRSGERVPFDILILAVGVKPNTALVKDAGGAVGRGITVDTMMQTSLPDVYAAGDCTECTDLSSGTTRVLAILPNAYLQGRCAGYNMAGEKKEFANAVPMNSIGFFGLHAMTAGTCFSPEQGGECYEETGEDSLKRLYTKDGYLTGMILIGNVARAGIYTNLIRNRVPLKTVDFETLRKSPALAPFGATYRKAKLGGAL